MEQESSSRQDTTVAIIVAVSVVIIIGTISLLLTQITRLQQPLEEYSNVIVPTPPPISKEREFCIQVVTPAYNPATGECYDFGTPCDVPSGWTTVDECTPTN